MIYLLFVLRGRGCGNEMILRLETAIVGRHPSMGELGSLLVFGAGLRGW
jgi:hypothetical protein